MKLFLQISFFLIIQSFASSQESKADYYFGVELRWTTVCEYDLSLERCTSNDVGPFSMEIEKYPDKIGSLVIDYNGKIKFNVIDISFSDPDHYVLNISDKNSKLYTAILSLGYIPDSRIRMYTKLIISDGVEALLFETDMGALEYMKQEQNRNENVEEFRVEPQPNSNIQKPETEQTSTSSNLGKIYSTEYHKSSDGAPSWLVALGITIYLLFLLGIILGIYFNLKK